MNQEDERMEMNFGAMLMNPQDQRMKMNFGAMEMNQEDQRMRMNFGAMGMNFGAMEMNREDERMEMNFGAMQMNPEDQRMEMNFGAMEMNQEDQRMEMNFGAMQMNPEDQRMEMNFGAMEMNQEDQRMRMNFGAMGMNFGAMETNQEDERMEMNFGAMQMNPEDQRMEMNFGAMQMNQEDERMEMNFGAMQMNPEDQRMEMNFGAMQMNPEDQRMEMNFGAMQMNAEDKRMEMNQNQLVQWNHHGQDEVMKMNQDPLVQWNHYGQDERDAYFLSLAPGVRFLPTDRELILYFLKRKVMNQVLPMNSIVEVHIYQYSPQKLFEMFQLDINDRRYFLTPRDRKYPNGNRPNRTAGDGFWKASAGDHAITMDNNEIIGYKKSLVYHEGKPKNRIKTNWLMNEFRLSKTQLDTWVVCEIYKKSAKSEMRPCNQYNTSTADDGGQRFPYYGPPTFDNMHILEDGGDESMPFGNGVVPQYAEGLRLEPQNPQGGFGFGYPMPGIIPQDQPRFVGEGFPRELVDEGVYGLPQTQTAFNNSSKPAACGRSTSVV